MKRVIFKYQLQQGITKIELPVQSQILCVKEQEGILMLWVIQIVLDTPQKTLRTFNVFGTGEIIEGHARYSYIGTVVIKNTGFVYVWHVFEDPTVSFQISETE